MLYCPADKMQPRHFSRIVAMADCSYDTHTKRPNHFLTVPELTYKQTFFGLNRDQQSVVAGTIQEQLAQIRYAFEDMCNLPMDDLDFPVMPAPEKMEAVSKLHFRD
jgi:hypothetical protein